MDLRNERERLLYYSKGLLTMVRECKNGRNVHLCGNLEQTLVNCIKLLEDQKAAIHLERIRDQLPPVASRVRKEYRDWWDLKTRGKPC